MKTDVYLKQNPKMTIVTNCMSSWIPACDARIICPVMNYGISAQLMKSSLIMTIALTAWVLVSQHAMPELYVPVMNYGTSAQLMKPSLIMTIVTYRMSSCIPACNARVVCPCNEHICSFWMELNTGHKGWMVIYPQFLPCSLEERKK